MRRLASILLLTGLSACATPAVEALRQDPGDLPSRAEAAAVPFFPQEDLWCGPAALTTVLVWSGLDVTQDEIAAQVYTPGREGTLRTDLLAGARRNGRLAVPVDNLRDLLTELAAGHPVVVFQNLGLSWVPQWHYAVAAGYDLEAGEILLRSGTIRELVNDLSTFERTWARGDYWGLTVLPPDQLPASADEVAILEAAIALERVGRPTAAAQAYAATLQRWPESLGAGVGLGNARYASGDPEGAAAAFSAVVERHPDAAAAWNNLAYVLGELGEHDRAVKAAETAVAIGGEDKALYERTLERLHQRADSPPVGEV